MNHPTAADVSDSLINLASIMQRMPGTNLATHSGLFGYYMQGQLSRVNDPCDCFAGNEELPENVIYLSERHRKHNMIPLEKTYWADATLITLTAIRALYNVDAREVKDASAEREIAAITRYIDYLYPIICRTDLEIIIYESLLPCYVSQAQAVVMSGSDSQTCSSIINTVGELEHKFMDSVRSRGGVYRHD